MTTLTNDQITAGAAVLDLDLDELQALCDAVKRPWYGTLQIADGVTDDDATKFIEAFSPDTVSELIAAVRHAPSPQVAEGEELPPLPEPDGSASVPVDESRATFTEVDAWSEELVRQAQRDAIAASRRAAGGEVYGYYYEWASCITTEGPQGFRWRFDREAPPEWAVEEGQARNVTPLYATPAPASAGQAAPAMVEQYDGPWPTVEMTVAGKRMLEKQTSIEHIKKYSAGITNSIYEAMHAASPVGIAAQPAEGASPVEQFASDLAARQVVLPADFANVLADMPYEEEPAEGAGQAGQVAKWHAPGMGEVHYHDHSLMIDCQREIDDPSQDYIADDELAKRVCAALNATESAAAPADHEIREAVNKLRDLAVQFHAHQSLRDRIAAVVLPLVRATHQPSAQDGGN